MFVEFNPIKHIRLALCKTWFISLYNEEPFVIKIFLMLLKSNIEENIMNIIIDILFCQKRLDDIVIIILFLFSSKLL